jgi:transcriptional antiterminator Rof (Rho-off)
LNLKYNPLAEGNAIGSANAGALKIEMKIEYLERVRENAPNLITLDDQDIDDIKLSEALTVDDSVEDCSMFKQLVGLGIKQSTLLSVVADKLPKKQNEELIIVQSIKSQDPEIKASRNI